MFDLFNQPPLEVQMPEHNRYGNDAAYQANKKHFKNQTEIVWNHLKQGDEVTSEMMWRLYGIQDTRARIYTIRKSIQGTNQKIIERRIPGASGAKGWRLIEQ